jgi:hypothetical protein
MTDESPSDGGLAGLLLPHESTVQEPVTVVPSAQTVAPKAPSFFSRYIARYTLHGLYLFTLLTAIIGGYFLGTYVKTEVESMKESCRSMQGTCDDCTDAVAMIKPYILLIANFTQGCPTAMDELKTATYFSMLNCREEGKCKPLPMFKKP